MMTETTIHSPDLLRGAAHLLRTPLGVILGLAGTLRDYDARFTAEQRARYLGEVIQAAEEMREALDGLSLLARLLGGDLPVAPAPVPVAEAAAVTAGALESVWGAGTVRPQPAPGALRADVERLRQAAQALARAVAPSGTAAVAVSVDADGALRIGPATPRGARADVAAALDPPVEALDLVALIARATTWPLLVARLLVEAQGGRLTAHDAAAGEEGGGLALRLSLPAALA